jgi:Icc protein
MIHATPLLVAQVTDIHLFANASKELLGLPTAKSFQAVREQLQKLSPQPDLLLLTGDLSQDGNPETLIGLHHPPLLVNSDWLDSSTLQNSEELFETIARHPQVRLVVFGHIHQEFER